MTHRPVDASKPGIALACGLAERTPRPLLAATLALWRQAGETHWLPIVGTSMLPLLQPGDYVQVAHGRRNLQPGALLIFQQQEQLIAHRLIYRHGPAQARIFLTKGDNVVTFDPPLRAEAILGQAVAFRRAGQLIRLDRGRWRLLHWLIARVTLVLFAVDLWVQPRTGQATGGLTPGAAQPAFAGKRLWKRQRRPQRWLRRLLRVAAYLVSDKR